MDALEMAWFQRGPNRKTELIFHSDRGSQYASQEFRMALEERAISVLGVCRCALV
jgi:transposase InsO family protein